jgi:hypothetical protein
MDCLIALRIARHPTTIGRNCVLKCLFVRLKPIRKTNAGGACPQLFVSDWFRLLKVFYKNDVSI